MKMKKKNVIQVFSLILCAVCMLVLPSTVVRAEEPTNEESVYYDTEQGRFVQDLDDYLTKLNSGLITPYDSTITNYESDLAPFDISDPSESCSNIFGHKWGDWGNWEEVSRVHFPKPPCAVNMERWRFCTRTHCNAHQIETDIVWVNVCSH